MIYEGIDPITGKERRSWHPAGTDRAEAERLGHAHIAHTIQTYQHLLPGMGADAAARFGRLAGPVPTDDPDSEERRGNTRRNTA